ncbi:hypothetical protein Q8A67_024347 [Cirrhinus molitorella]|uniref:Uncharacterized protein n=1 Tax=Cirrhinus molitorella TaxID=172907 RepID=A0AA88P1U1_9TELE|nr:hypothetical protein Q8A67_024347 [Cirrhinus molitorella]
MCVCSPFAGAAVQCWSDGPGNGCDYELQTATGPSCLTPGAPLTLIAQRLLLRKSFSPGEKRHFRPGGKPKPPQTDRSSPCLKLHLKGPWQHFHLASLPS